MGRGDEETPRASVRPATAGDAGAIWEMIREFAAFERLEHLATGSAARLAGHLSGASWPAIEGFVAETADGFAGYALYYGVYSTFWTSPMVWLEDLYVRESFRGRGVGRALLARVARVAVERGCVRLDWAVLDWNRPAMEFYEGLGASRHGGWNSYRVSDEALRALAARADD